MTDKVTSVSVIVPVNPFITAGDASHCLCALDVEKLMEWWPGMPHAPHRNAIKVKSIQRSLDWKRVASIAAYLLQKEILNVPEKIEEYFGKIYEPKKYERGREWPPKVNKIASFQRSVYPSFSNILVHVNGAELVGKRGVKGAAELVFDPQSRELNFTVIDGQHRVNGAYLAIKLLQEESSRARWEIPAEVFVDLDKAKDPPKHQAQIFIDVNFYQKKVDKSLVSDLFPTARGGRKPLDNKERAQDIGRRLMLEQGPLRGLVQIPGIKYGVKDVITLSTLVGAIEDVLDYLYKSDLTSLDEQTDFISQALDAWLHASGRREMPVTTSKLETGNVVYQGRIMVSVINLLPAMLSSLAGTRSPLISKKSEAHLVKWSQQVMQGAGFIKNGRFIDKDEFKKGGYLGSGGIGRFRDRLWAAVGSKKSISRMGDKKVAELAKINRDSVVRGLS